MISELRDHSSASSFIVCIVAHPEPTHAVQVCAHLRDADAIVYGIGSLYTSIAPSLILRGVGEAVSERECPKVLLLNGCHDRESSLCLTHDGPMHAVCF